MGNTARDSEVAAWLWRRAWAHCSGARAVERLELSLPGGHCFLGQAPSLQEGQAGRGQPSGSTARVGAWLGGCLGRAAGRPASQVR